MVRVQRPETGEQVFVLVLGGREVRPGLGCLTLERSTFQRWPLVRSNALASGSSTEILMRSESLMRGVGPRSTRRMANPGVEVGEARSTSHTCPYG